MWTRIFRSVLFVLPVGVAACSASGPDGDDATTRDELRALKAAEVVGDIQYGETKSGLGYDESLTYRALSFEGSAGDEIQIDVSAGSADARAWLLAANYRTLRLNDDASSGTRDARITYELGTTGKYFIVFREKNYEDATFSVSLSRTNGPATPPSTSPTTPPVAPPTNDPLDPASCEGPAHPNPASLFPPGGTLRNLGKTIVQWQTRQCNAITGCTPWKNYGSSLAGVQWAGRAELSVYNNAMDLNFYGDVHQWEQARPPVAHCRVGAGASLSCDPRNYVGTRSIALTGVMKQTCIRITGEDQDVNPITGQPNGNEYRVAMLVRF